MSNTAPWMFPPPMPDVASQTPSGLSTIHERENINPPPSFGFRFGDNEHAVHNQHEVVPQEHVGDFGPNNIPAADSEHDQVPHALEHARDEALGGIGMNDRQQYDPGRPPKTSEPRRTGRKRVWTKPETSFLVECKEKAFRDEGSPYRKQKSNAINWEAISTAMRENRETLGLEKTGDQCRLRWDTLVKSHRIAKKFCSETRKSYAELKKEEIRELRLATTLEKTWYEVIDTMSSDARARKSDDLPPSADACPSREGRQENRLELLESSLLTATDPLLAAPGAPPWMLQNFPSTNALAQESSEKPRPRRSNASTKQIAIPGFSSLDLDVRTTLLDLILGSSFLGDRSSLFGDKRFSEYCTWLSIIQNRSCSNVFDEVTLLLKMELVHLTKMNRRARIDVSRLREFDKFVKKVILKNPVYDTQKYLRCWDDAKFISATQFALPQQMRVLSLYECEGLERVELSGLPRLRSLWITECRWLQEVTGWECLRELGWLEICRCGSYADYPDLRNLSALRELVLIRYIFKGFPAGLEFDVSQCVRLRRLEIFKDKFLEDSGDLSSLRCLEVLRFSDCHALSTLRGFSGLHSLTRLKLPSCRALRRLPYLGHMQDLVSVDISRTGVEEIPGVEKLVSLKRLDCWGSKLKVLPDLRHLPELRSVVLWGTPLYEDRSSFYFSKYCVRFSCEETEVVDVSDISDTEDTPLEWGLP